MSVEQKLKTIAENEPKVYEAGKLAGAYEVGYENGHSEGYDTGFEAGKAQGGGGLYDTEINNLLAVAPFLKRPEEYLDDFGNVNGYSGFLVGYHGGVCSYAIVPPWVAELGEGATDEFPYCEAFIFTSTTPPKINLQGMWESWGGTLPPEKIFVPDASIDAYKVTTNLAGFADRIYPLSQYDGEGYYGGLYNG